MALKDLLHLLPLISVANSLLFEPPSSNRHISVQKPNQIEKRAPAGSNFVNIGCYVDTINPRTLPAYSTSSDGMSNEYCQTLCDARGYSIAGTQWARECWCDVRINQELRTRDNECDMICTGAAETCGGSARLTVWQNQGTVTDPDSLVYGEWQGIGCFIDQIGNRALPHQVYVDGDMTIEKCTSQCFNEGYTVAGAEFANECFCAFSISSPKADDRGCDMSCSGNPAEICGGGNRITVYRYNPPPTSSSVSTGTSTSIGPGSTETESPTMTETTSTSTSTPTSTVLPAGPYRVQVVRSADNSLLGYIAQENGPFVLPTYTTDPTAALLVESEVPKQMPQGGTCTELRELNPPDALHPYLAAYYATTNYNINSAVSQTPAGSTKQPTGTTRSPAAMGESCIWRLDPITLGLSQFWVEDDATTITDRHLYYFGSGTTGYFMSARNPVTFEAIFPTAFPVHFVLQQVSP